MRIIAEEIYHEQEHEMVSNKILLIRQEKEAKQLSIENNKNDTCKTKDSGDIPASVDHEVYNIAPPPSQNKNKNTNDGDNDCYDCGGF